MFQHLNETPEQYIARLEKAVACANEKLNEALQWHNGVMASLSLIVDKKDADINLSGVSTIKAGTDVHKGFRIGAIISTTFVKDFPIKEDDLPWQD